MPSISLPWPGAYRLDDVVGLFKASERLSEGFGVTVSAQGLRDGKLQMMHVWDNRGNGVSIEFDGDNLLIKWEVADAA